MPSTVGKKIDEPEIVSQLINLRIGRDDKTWAQIIKAKYDKAINATGEVQVK